MRIAKGGCPVDRTADELSQAPIGISALHPNLPEIYRKRIDALYNSLLADEQSAMQPNLALWRGEIIICSATTL